MGIDSPYVIMCTSLAIYIHVQFLLSHLIGYGTLNELMSSCVYSPIAILVKWRHTKTQLKTPMEMPAKFSLSLSLSLSLSPPDIIDVRISQHIYFNSLLCSQPKSLSLSLSLSLCVCACVAWLRAVPWTTGSDSGETLQEKAKGL
jgi:hypothetical protein